MPVELKIFMMEQTTQGIDGFLIYSNMWDDLIYNLFLI
jgi:hypothetical protein